MILLRLVEYIDNYVPVEPEPTDPEPSEPQPTDPQPTDPQPTDPQPTDPQPTDPQPTDPRPTEPQPTDPQPTDPEPTEPEPSEPKEPIHIHTWKINHTDVSLNVGERIRLSVYCSGKGCSDVADSPWIASTPDVVTIDGRYITGAKAGWNTWLSTEWEGVTYKCIFRVRSQKNDAPIEILPL